MYARPVIVTLAFALPGRRATNGTTASPHPLTAFEPVTDAILRNPDAADWIMMRGNYQGWGYSKLDQINKSNVKGLQLAWSRTMEAGNQRGHAADLQGRDVSG